VIWTQDDFRLLKYSPYIYSHPSTLKKSFAVGKLHVYSRINPILLAVTGLSGILGAQHRHSSPNHIYIINEIKIEETLKSPEETLYIKLARI